MSILYEPVAFQDLLLDVMETCKTDAEAKGLALHYAFPSVPITVEVDSKRIHQVLVNLLNNAIKYTAQGGEIWLTATADQTHFICYVKDNGRGISPDLLPKIFDIFTQADTGQTNRSAGLGIGLTVVKEIVSLHQGTVEVRSEGPGKGSEFTVRIPLREPHGSEPEPFPSPEQSRL